MSFGTTNTQHIINLETINNLPYPSPSSTDVTTTPTTANRFYYLTMVENESGVQPLNTDGETAFLSYRPTDGNLFAALGELSINKSATDTASITGTTNLNLAASSHITINEAYNLPQADGTNGQVITTDGSGNVTWQTPTNGPIASGIIPIGTGTGIIESSLEVTDTAGVTSIFTNDFTGLKLGGTSSCEIYEAVTGNSVKANSDGTVINDVSGNNITTDTGGLNVSILGNKGAANQVLSTAGNVSDNITFNDQKICIQSNATILSDSTNPAGSTLYLLSNFTSTPVPPTAVSVPICTFPLVDTKSYTLVITLCGTNIPLVNGSITVGVATNTYTAASGSGSITFSPTPIAASQINFTSADFNQPGGISISQTWTQSGGSNLATIYFSVNLGTVWTSNSDITIGCNLYQNN